MVLRSRGVQKQWLVFYFCGRILNLINSKRLGVAVALPVIVQAFNWLGFPHRVWVSAATPEAKLHTYSSAMSGRLAQLKTPSTMMLELVSLSIVSPHVVARAFQVLAKSCINIIKVEGPFTGPNGMTL